MWRWLLLSGVVVALDQASKYVAVAKLSGHLPVEVESFFNLVLVYNRGAAFSFLAGAGGWQRELFTGIALIASAWIIYLLRRHPQQSLFCVALALVLGGAIGNVIDRVMIGAVVDFLDFHAWGLALAGVQCRRLGDHLRRRAAVWDGLRGELKSRENHK